MKVRTRFAPSPTGYLHVGGVRTALFSWLYARHFAGEFILRIEDTDQERSTKESVQAIIDGMQWLGLDYDHEPIYQSHRHARYQDAANWLLEQEKAYICTCTKERLEALREKQLAAKEKPRYDGHCRDKKLKPGLEPYVIRFKNPLDGSVFFLDQVYGDITVENSELDDLILIRSDGFPTYNFAVVIDDWDMQITHVIRGDDHINNTPRQINLYQAFRAPIPVFAHLPMILGDDGKRLSKRHGAVSVLQFKEEGILPHALLNYLVRLGWSHGDQEIFSRQEMIDFFSLDHVSRGVSSFNYEKLFWLNQYYLKEADVKETAKALDWQLRFSGINPLLGPDLTEIIRLQAERCKTLAEVCERSQYFFLDLISYDDEAVKKHLRPVVLAPLKSLYQRFQQESNWTANKLHEHLDVVCQDFQINLGKLGQPLRVAVTGTSMSPAIDKTLELIGKERTISRLQYALQRIEERAKLAE